jgi:hypothetical protein
MKRTDSGNSERIAVTRAANSPDPERHRVEKV